MQSCTLLSHPTKASTLICTLIHTLLYRRNPSRTLPGLMITNHYKIPLVGGENTERKKEKRKPGKGTGTTTSHYRTGDGWAGGPGPSSAPRARAQPRAKAAPRRLRLSLLRAPKVSGALPGADQAQLSARLFESQMESMLQAASMSRGTSTRQWGQYFSRPGIRSVPGPQVLWVMVLLNSSTTTSMRCRAKARQGRVAGP